MPIGAATPRGSNALGVGARGAVGGGVLPEGSIDDLLDTLGFKPPSQANGP
jgi:hypothetical protein